MLTPGSDSGQPAGLIRGPRGSLYVITNSGGTYADGTLFQLTPPSAGGADWTGTLLYTFSLGPGGAFPSSLVAGPGGSLYGTAALVGSSGNGSAFQLVPPGTSGGPWTETDLYEFQGLADGSGPNGVIRGPHGSLYGTTLGRYPAGGNGQGTVFQLTPPSIPGGPWTKTILHSFGEYYNCGPDSPLILSGGNLYGAACQSLIDGVIFELQPPAQPGGSWTYTALHTFTNSEVPGGAMVLRDGILYGAAISHAQDQPGGTIYAIKLK